METLTILGGGSAYTPGLVQALIGQSRALALRTVRLAGSGTNVRETLLLQANGDVHHMLTRPLP